MKKYFSYFFITLSSSIIGVMSWFLFESIFCIYLDLFYLPTGAGIGLMILFSMIVLYVQIKRFNSKLIENENSEIWKQFKFTVQAYCISLFVVSITAENITSEIYNYLERNNELTSETAIMLEDLQIKQNLKIIQ